MYNLSKYNNNIILINTYRYQDDFITVYLLDGNVNNELDKYTVLMTNNKILTLYSYEINKILVFEENEWKTINITDNYNNSIYKLYNNIINKNIHIKNIFNNKEYKFNITDVQIHDSRVAVGGYNINKNEYYDLDILNYEIISVE